MLQDVQNTAPEQAYESNSVFWVEVEKIVPNPFQPRKEFNEQKLQELAESIRMYGVLQPLVVTRKEITLPSGAFRTEYEIIAGERRLRASKLAGLSQVPVLIRSGQETELMKLELAIIENLQREDLNPVDRALAFEQLASQFGLSHKEIGRRMGRSRVYVANSIRLLGLPETILTALRTGEISDGHARTLLMLKDRPEEQDVLFREILLKKLSVREVEHLSRQIATEKVRKRSWKDLEPELKELEKRFSESLGTKVQIAKTEYGGKVVIDYFSEDDLMNILTLVRGSGSVFSIPTKEKGKEQREALASVVAATGIEQASPEPYIPAIIHDGVHETDKAEQEDYKSALEDLLREEPYEAPNESNRAMEEEVQEVALDGHEVPEERAIEVDDPNDHALAEPNPIALGDVAENDLVPIEPQMSSVQNTQTSVLANPFPHPEEKQVKQDEDDLYSLSNFSL